MKQGALAKGKVHLPLSHGPSCYRSRELQRENVSLFWVYLHANLNVLNLDFKKKKRTFLDWYIAPCFSAYDPEENLKAFKSLSRR